MIGEELGLLGGTLILVGFLLLVGTGLRIAVAAEHEFDKLLAAGLTALLGFQAFIIIAGVTRLLPLTGVTLPFVSYGGSSLIANYVILALLMRISDDTTRRQAERDGRRNRGPAAGGWREQADPPAGDLPRRLLRRPVRDAEQDPGLRGRSPERATREHRHHPHRLRPQPRDHLHRRRHGDRRVGPGGRRVRVPAALSRRATCSPRSPASTPSSSAPPGLERSYQDELVGDTAEQQLRGFADLFVGEDQVGDLRTSLRDDLQQQAKDSCWASGGARWSPSTRGRARSWPSGTTRPMTPTSWPATTSTTSGSTRAFLQPDSPDSALVATSYQDRYFPGSTFKVVVGLQRAEVRRGQPRRPVVPGRVVLGPAPDDGPMDNSHTCGGTLFAILAESCNTSFARMAVETLRRRPDHRGGRGLRLQPGAADRPARPGGLQLPHRLHRQRPRSGPVGHRPERRAGLAPADGAGGRRHRQRRRDRWRPTSSTSCGTATATSSTTYDPEVWRQPISAEDAATMQEAMRGVVDRRHGDQPGQAARPRRRGQDRDGPARAPTRPASHAWMIAWAGPPGGRARDRRGRAGRGHARRRAARPRATSVAGPIARCIDRRPRLEVGGRRRLSRRDRRCARPAPSLPCGAVTEPP